MPPAGYSLCADLVPFPCTLPKITQIRPATYLLVVVVKSAAKQLRVVFHVGGQPLRQRHEVSEGVSGEPQLCTHKGDLSADLQASICNCTGRVGEVVRDSYIELDRKDFEKIELGVEEPLQVIHQDNARPHILLCFHIR